MKKCPYCAEEIQEDAIKCKHCGEFLEKKDQIQWYFKTSWLVIIFLCAGPLVLPLIWFHPGYIKKTKISLTIVLGTVSFLFVLGTIRAIKVIKKSYQEVYETLQLYE